MKQILPFIMEQKYIFFVVALSLLASWPLFHIGLMPTHDGEYHLIRFFEFDKMLRSGNLYPRWAPDLFFGYGIPLFTYIYPFPNYMASFLHLFGTSFLDTVKLNMTAATLMGSVFFYLWTKRFWGNFGALVSSVFYTFSPYHFVDIYVRGSVGEVWALGIFPAFLWSYTKFFQTKKPVFAVLSVIFLAITIFSHNILGLMFFIFAVCYVGFLLFLNKQKLTSVLISIVIIFLALSLSAIFWLPALFQTNYVTGLQIYDIFRNFPDLSQLLFPSWGTEFFGSGTGNEMSVQIGVMNLLAVGLSLFTFISYWRKKDKKAASIILFFLIWFFVLFFFMTSFSYPLWKAIPLIHYFQFPWRLLSLVILVCSFLAGSLTTLKWNKIISWIFIFLAIVLTISYTYPAYYMIRTDAYYTSRSNFIDGTNSVGNMFNTIWNTIKTEHAKELFTTGEGQQITNMHKISPTSITATATTDKKIQQSLALSYFPGWNVIVDNKQVAVFQKNGLVTFYLEPGKHMIEIKLGQTTIEMIATIISITSMLLLIPFFLLRKKLT